MSKGWQMTKNTLQRFCLQWRVSRGWQELRNVSLRGCAAQTLPSQNNTMQMMIMMMVIYFCIFESLLSFLSLPKQHNTDDCDDNGDDVDNADLKTNVIIPTFIQNVFSLVLNNKLLAWKWFYLQKSLGRGLTSLRGR